jgi:hypothetical protein
MPKLFVTRRDGSERAVEADPWRTTPSLRANLSFRKRQGNPNRVGLPHRTVLQSPEHWNEEEYECADDPSCWASRCC